MQLYIFTSWVIIFPYWIQGTFACEESAIVSCLTTDKVFITENLTHIVHSNTSDKCRFVIPKEPGVCQVKFDFLSFQLGDATPLGDCSPTEILTVMGSTTVKTISVCGNLTSQHMFLDFGDSDKIEVDINGRRKNVNYDILVTQLKCNHPNRAPPHCLQYYKTQEGTVKSFNYPRQQLNEQAYTVCVEAVNGSKGIKWKPCAETDSESFFISGNLSKEKSLGPTTGTQCYADYVQIFGDNRRCGSSFLPQTSLAKPYMLWVHFDSSELPGVISPPPIISLPVSNRLDFNRFGHAAVGTTSTCPDMSAIGLVCSPPSNSCEGNEPGSRRGKDNICTCTFPSMNADSMNTGFCLQFSQI